MHLINYKPSLLNEKIGELWSTNKKVIGTQVVFFRDTFQPLGCWPLKFLHALGIDQGLLVHTPNRDRVPLKKIKSEYLKFGLKLSI